jgi:REP element-mobilizing transposase RayT
LKEFYRKAAQLLEYPLFWIDEAKRQAISDAIAEVVVNCGYTVWACAILSNHVHMVIRRHRDNALQIWRSFADRSRDQLRQKFGLNWEHPVWAARPYKVFLHTPAEVRSRILYINRNPEKEGLAWQEYAFVKRYNNLPFHRSAK